MTDDEYRLLMNNYTHDLPMRLRVLDAAVGRVLRTFGTGLNSRALREAVGGRARDVDAARNQRLAEGILEKRRVPIRRVLHPASSSGRPGSPRPTETTDDRADPAR